MISVADPVPGNHQLESRMRETRTSGSVGGGTDIGRSSLPQSNAVRIHCVRSTRRRTPPRASAISRVSVETTPEPHAEGPIAMNVTMSTCVGLDVHENTIADP